MLTHPCLRILKWFEFLICIPAFPFVILSIFQLQAGSLSPRYDIKGVWCRLQHVTFCRRLQSTPSQTMVPVLAQIFRLFLFPGMNEEWLVQRSHLSLIRQNSVHPSERELVITGLQGTITEYCFREQLTPSCFVFARWETSKAMVWRPAEDELQLGVKSVLSNSCIYLFISSFFNFFFFFGVSTSEQTVKPDQMREMCQSESIKNRNSFLNT